MVIGNQINDFIELFPCVVTALNNIISEWNDGSGTSTDASMLLNAIDSEFLVALQVIKVLIFILTYILNST